MKINNNVQGSFFVARADYNRNTVIITDTGEFGCLKVLANRKKYFRAYDPEFYRVDSFLTKKKLTNKVLKDFFIHSLETGYKWTGLEKEELARYFRVNLDKYLSEKQKGWHKDHYNYNKAEKWERPPAKRKTPARNIKRR